MAHWSDFLSLVLTLSVIVALVYGTICLNQQWRKAVQSTKDRLHNRGIDVTKTGASVKTHSKLANREAYFDATQRGIVKALNKSTVGHDGSATHVDGTSCAAPPARISRHHSSSSVKVKS